MRKRRSKKRRESGEQRLANNLKHAKAYDNQIKEMTELNWKLSNEELMGNRDKDFYCLI